MKLHKINPVPNYDKATDYFLMCEFFESIKDRLTQDEIWELIWSIQKALK